VGKSCEEAGREKLEARAAFVHGDATRPITWAALPWRPTHILLFDDGFPPATLQGVAARLAAVGSWRYLVTTKTAAAWERASRKSFALKELAHLSVKMVGSGEGKTMRVMERR
jgi:hypothetical protein